MQNCKISRFFSLVNSRRASTWKWLIRSLPEHIGPLGFPLVSQNDRQQYHHVGNGVMSIAVEVGCPVAKDGLSFAQDVLYKAHHVGDGNLSVAVDIAYAVVETVDCVGVERTEIVETEMVEDAPIEIPHIAAADAHRQRPPVGGERRGDLVVIQPLSEIDTCRFHVVGEIPAADV